jgi:hypothetical protein
LARQFDSILGGFSGTLRSASGSFGVNEARADKPQLYPKEPSLNAANAHKSKRKEPGGIFRKPSRPSEVGIYCLGLIALIGGFGGGDLLIPAGRLLR